MDPINSHCKRILITGATSGIGYQAAANLIKAGHKLIIPCRDEDTIENIKIKLTRTNLDSLENSSILDFPILEMSDLESVDSFCSEMLNQGEPIDTIILNAGMQYTGSLKPRWSSQGFELTFAINHLAHQYIAQRLFPLLVQSRKPKLIITASEVHNPDSPGGKFGKQAGLNRLEGLRRGNGFEMIDGISPFNADKAYKDSKLCNVLFAREFFRRLRLKGATFPVIAWAPGLVIPRTSKGFFRYSRRYNELGQRIFALIVRDILGLTETVENAGKILMSLAISSEYESSNFYYLTNTLKAPRKLVFTKGEISDEASNDSLAKELWLQTSMLLGLHADL